MAYWVYVLRCSNGSLYTGYTNDLQKRYQEHLAGEGAKYTRSFKPIEIAQAWRVFIDKSLAWKIESYIKSLSRKEKLELIEQPQQLVDLFGAEVISIESSNLSV